MDYQEKIKKLEMLYESKQELEGIIERAREGQAQFFAQQLEAVKKEIQSLEVTL